MRVRRRGSRDRERPAAAPPVYLDARIEFAWRYLAGEGLEIGALHMPLSVPPQARVSYVDRMGVDELRSEYPELGDWDLVRVDVVDDGEKLETVADGSQDFIIANHFLEHCEDPIGTIGVHLGKLRPGGVLFYAVPDKRYTFDFRRPLTPIEHMVADHEEGPQRSRRDHYAEWARLVSEDPDVELAPEKLHSAEALEHRAEEIDAASYSIHMHVWTQAEFLRLLLHCRERSDGTFDIEAAARQGLEFVVVLRKAGEFPPPNPVTPEASDGQEPRLAQLEQDNQRLRRQLDDISGSASWRVTAPLRDAKRALRRARARLRRR